MHKSEEHTKNGNRAAGACAGERTRAVRRPGREEAPRGAAGLRDGARTVTMSVYP